MRARTRAEAVQLALRDVYEADRKRKRLRPFFAAARKIQKAKGWVPWWDYRPHDAPTRKGYVRTGRKDRNNESA